MLFGGAKYVACCLWWVITDGYAVGGRLWVVGRGRDKGISTGVFDSKALPKKVDHGLKAPCSTRYFCYTRQCY